MENSQLSPQFQRQQKFLLMIPVLVLPFLIMFFWAMGGGQGTKSKEAGPQPKGINTNLPNAHFKDDRGENKMAYYDQAAVDSTKLLERIKNERYYNNRIYGNKDSAINGLQVTKDLNEERVYQKLSQLNEQLNKTSLQMPETLKKREGGRKSAVSTADIDRLENMMHIIKGQSDEPDPQMTKINGVLDKLMAIQHPEMVKDTIKKLGAKAGSEVYAVRPVNNEDTTSHHQYNSFHILGENHDLTQTAVIAAVVPETQTLVNGATIKLQLDHDVMIKGQLVVKGTFIYGTVALNNERLIVSINSIRAGNNIFPVTLQVFDGDGMAGIYIPGAITRDVVKQSGDESINSLGLTSLDPSIGAQAAAAGIQLAKSVISKKVRLIRVTVQSGYHLFLNSIQR